MKPVIENESHKLGIVFVHGIVSNNSIFDFLSSCVPDNSVVRYVVLDGHGSDALAFSRASMNKWRDQVRAAADEMSQVCSRVVIVGHSMGCLLAMEAATDGKVDGLFLLNPPMRLKLRASMLRNYYKVALGLTHRDRYAAAARAVYGISFDFNPLHYYGWLARFLELFREIRTVRNDVVSHLKCPVRVVISEKDEMVSPTSAREFAGLPSAKTLIFPAATHFYYSDKDKDTIRQEFIHLLDISV